jgi:diamine N-acetyltransferase
VPDPTAASHRVRRATPDDAVLLADLAALTFPLACPPGTAPEAIAEHVATRLNRDRFRDWATSHEHVLLLAERSASDGGPHLLGYALLVREAPQDADVASALGLADRAAGAAATPTAVELSKIYVHPAAQGTGVASTLMDSALTAAADLAAGLPVWLGTNGLNARAQAFYRKHGFETVGSRTYVVGGEEHSDVVMARP